MGSGLEERPEGRSHLGDEVGGRGGSAVFLEGLAVALPGEGAGPEGSQQERVGAAREGHQREARGRCPRPARDRCPGPGDMSVGKVRPPELQGLGDTDKPDTFLLPL